LGAIELSPATIEITRRSQKTALAARSRRAYLLLVTVSRRIGHSNPVVTLGVYAHLFGNTDTRAASAVEAAMSGILTE